MAKSFKSIAVIISLSLSCKSGQARPQLGRHDRQVSQDENIMTNMVKPSLVNMRGDSVEEPQPLAPSTLEAPDVATLKIDLKELNEIDSSLDKIVSVITAIKNLESMSQDLLKDVKRTTMSPVKETIQEKLDKQTKTSKKIKKSVPLDLIELYLDKILNHTNAGVKSVNLDNSDLDLIVDSAIKAFSDVDYEIFAKYTEDIKESRAYRSLLKPSTDILPIEKMLFLTDLLMTSKPGTGVNFLNKFKTEPIFNLIKNNSSIQLPVIESSLVYLSAVVRLCCYNYKIAKEKNHQETNFDTENALRSIFEGYFLLLDRNLSISNLEGYSEIRIKILKSMAYLLSKVDNGEDNQIYQQALAITQNTVQNGLSKAEQGILVSNNGFLLEILYNEITSKIITSNSVEYLSIDNIEALTLLITSRNDEKFISQNPTFKNIKIFRGFTISLTIFKIFKQFEKIESTNELNPNFPENQTNFVENFKIFTNFLSEIVRISTEENNIKFINEMVEMFLVDKNFERTGCNFHYLSALLAVLGAAESKCIDCISNLPTLTCKLLFEVTNLDIKRSTNTIICGKILAIIVNKSEKQDLINKILNNLKQFMQTRLFRSVPDQILHSGVFAMSVWILRALLIKGSENFKVLFGTFYKCSVMTNNFALGRSLKIILKPTEDLVGLVELGTDSTENTIESVRPDLLLTKYTNSKILPFWKQFYISTFINLLDHGRNSSNSSSEIEMVYISETISNIEFKEIGVSNLLKMSKCFLDTLDKVKVLEKTQDSSDMSDEDKENKLLSVREDGDQMTDTETKLKKNSKNIDLDEDLLLSALNGLELILRDSKDSAVKLLASSSTVPENKQHQESPENLSSVKYANLENLLANFGLIIDNRNQHNISINFKIRKEICVILGCLSILYDSNLLNIQCCDLIMGYLKVLVNDKKRMVRREAGRARSEWSLILGPK